VLVLDLVLLIVRLIVGLGFAAHGAQKLFGVFGGYGLAGTGGYFESQGWKPGKLFAAAAGTSELVGGLLVATGLLGPIGPMFVIATMVTAISVHWPAGFFGQSGGYELALLYTLFGLAFAFVGFGAYSIDALGGLTPLFTPLVDGVAVALGIVAGLANIALRRKPAPLPAPGS
jgi:putative oxidoreductase